MRSLKIGIVSETQVQQHYLKCVVEESGYRTDLLFLAENWQDQAAD